MHAFIHSCTHSFIHSRTHSFMHAFIHLVHDLLALISRLPCQLASGLVWTRGNLSYIWSKYVRNKRLPCVLVGFSGFHGVPLRPPLQGLAHLIPTAGNSNYSLHLCLSQILPSATENSLAVCSPMECPVAKAWLVWGYKGTAQWPHSSQL